MCNAHNHSRECNCGWGGVWYGNLPGSGAAPDGRNWHPDREHNYVEIRCWWCQKWVFFVRNSKTGGCFLCDKMGAPWPIHPCWAEHAADFPSHISYLLFERLSKRKTFSFLVQPASYSHLTLDFSGRIIWLQPTGSGRHDPAHTTPWYIRQRLRMVTAIEVALDEGQFAAINYLRQEANRQGIVYDFRIGDEVSGSSFWRRRHGGRWALIGGPLFHQGVRYPHGLEQPTDDTGRTHSTAPSGHAPNLSDENLEALRKAAAALRRRKG